jgi:hypothetical protein
MPKTLDLDDSPRTLVYRQLITFIRTDPTIRRVFRPAAVRAWDGSPADAAEFSVAMAPCVRFTPICGADLIEFPGAFAGDLLLNIELIVKGTCVDDLFNAWFALARAIYPRDPAARAANVQALVAAGAKTGIVEFSQPAFDAKPEEQWFLGSGQLKIAVLSFLN